MTYQPVLSVNEHMLVTKERWSGGYGVKSIPLVQPGQEVLPDQPVLRLEHSGQSEPRLPISPSQEMIPSGLHGRVVAITRRGGVVIESHVALVYGVVGAGVQVTGVLTLLQPEAAATQVIPPGAILVVTGAVNLALLYQAMRSGVVGIVGGSISLRDFEGFLHADLLQLLEYGDIERVQTYLPPLTLMFTEGIGSFSMSPRIVSMLSRYQGSIVLLSGMSSLRYNIAPELVISLPVGKTPPSGYRGQVDTSIVLGALVRITGGEYMRATGIIDYLFVYEQAFPSGARARAVRVVLDDGAYVIVPRALVERIG